MSAIDRFVQYSLLTEGKLMLRHQSARISSVVRSRSGYLKDSRHIEAAPYRLSFSHPIYERFLDMKRLGGKKIRKPRKIHNRFIYGLIGNITQDLMYGYTERVKQSYKFYDIFDSQ